MAEDKRSPLAIIAASPYPWNTPEAVEVLDEVLKSFLVAEQPAVTLDQKEAAMISDTKKLAEVRAFAWDEGEAAELHADEPDFDSLQRELMRQLETKEYGKIIRSYPANDGGIVGELTLWYRAFADAHRGRQIVFGTDEAELNESYQAHRTLCAQKVFTPAELYALRPVRVYYGSWHTVSVHLPEVPYYDIEADAMTAMEGSQRMETRTLVDHDYDGRRGWTLQTVWFDGQPVMVVNSSGRDGDEYHDRWITDSEAFGRMVAWLRSFLPAENLGYVEASSVIPAMTEFYSHTIHDYYDVDRQEPKNR